MSESTQLIPKDLTPGPLTQQDFNSLTTNVDYLPRFQLFGSKTDAVAEGKIPSGHYGLVKDDEITDLGEEVDVGLITWRSKAVDTAEDVPTVVFDASSDAFGLIKAKSTIQDSGCMYGPEFLLWIPSAETFAIYHMNSKTARKEAKKAKPLFGRAITLKCRLASNKKFKWHAPVIIPCSTAIASPPEDQLRKEWEKFHNPSENTPELAPDNDDSGRAR